MIAKATAQSPAPHGCLMPPAPAQPHERLSQSTEDALLEWGQALRGAGSPAATLTTNLQILQWHSWVLHTLFQGRERKESALNECQSGHLGYFRACLLFHAMYSPKKKPKAVCNTSSG